ncbi:hypothetical protein K2173_018006 [Erythroxylum novogranatense]|nr:hypothetical protein K2173_018006 [Erythroxylum novogranatense]
MKVVYISNPMKFKTSASEFRALVQELTGQDAELPDPSKMVGCDDVGGGHHQTVPDASKSTRKTVVDDGQHYHDEHAQQVPRVVELDPNREQPQTLDFCFDRFDDVFIPPHMLENISGVIPSSLLLELESATGMDLF